MVMRQGFSLVEVIVACTLLSVAVLTLAASGSLALGMLGSAQREEHAARLAGSLLDSLVLVPHPGTGAMQEGGAEARWWTAADGAVTVSVTYHEAGKFRRHFWSSRQLTPVQRLRTLPGVRP